MKQSENINELIKALSAAQRELTNPHKDKSGYGYKYADLGSMINHCREAIAKYGLSVNQGNYSREDKVGVTTQLSHSSGQWMRSDIEFKVNPQKGMTEIQAAGTTLTYLRRYSYASMLGISTEEDTDGNGNSKDHKKPAYEPKQTYEKKSSPKTDSVTVAFVRSLMTRANITKEEEAEWCRKRNVETLDNFSDYQLKTLAAFLQSKIKG